MFNAFLMSVVSKSEHGLSGHKRPKKDVRDSDIYANRDVTVSLTPSPKLEYVVSIGICCFYKSSFMALITSAFTSAIVIAAVSVIPALFSRKSKSVKAKTKENGEKYIELSSFVFWVIYGGGAVFTIVGLLVYLFSDEPEAGIISGVLGLVLIMPAILLTFVDTTVNWSSKYICGAKSGVSIKKNRILWEDVEFVKYHPNNTIQIKDKTGNSVFWSVYYNGWSEVISDLRAIRPDIDTSDFN